MSDKPRDGNDADVIKAFEKWAKAEGYDLDPPPSTYLGGCRYWMSSTEHAWQAWQACERSKSND